MYKCGLCAHLTLEFSRKRESYNERITHTLIIAYLTYTIVTIEIVKSVGYAGKSVRYVGKVWVTPTLIDRSDQLEVTYYDINI